MLYYFYSRDDNYRTCSLNVRHHTKQRTRRAKRSSCAMAAALPSLAKLPRAAPTGMEAEAGSSTQGANASDIDATTSNDDESIYGGVDLLPDNTNTAVSLAIWQWWNTSLKYSNLKGGRDLKRVVWYKSLHEGITDWESLGKAWSAIKKLLEDEDEDFKSKEVEEDLKKIFADLKSMILYNLKDTVEYKAIMAEHAEHEEGKPPDTLNAYYWLFQKAADDYPVFSKERGDEIAEWLMKYKNPNDGLEDAAQKIARARTLQLREAIQLLNRLYAIRDQLRAVRDSQPRAEYRY